MEVRPVRNRRDLNAFIRLPLALYLTSPAGWRRCFATSASALDRERNPFFAHAEAEYLLAYRDGRPVGRISAHIDHRLNEFQDNDWGLWGWFECEEDHEAATALFTAAEAWLRERGRGTMVGPMDFTTNDECGLLIEGHERRRSSSAPGTTRTTSALVDEQPGQAKAMDLYMWSLHVTGRDKVNPLIWEVAGRVESEHGIVCRNFDKKDMDREIARFLEVYNAAWERNWGAVPLSEAEVRHMAKDLKPILDENWAMVAERKDTGEIVGVALTLPDYNQVLAKLRPPGRLLPFGWLTFLRERPRIDAVRVFALGVKPEYQHTGIAARFYEMHFDAAERTPQKGGEMGWILEVNRPMNRAMEGMGGEIVRRYRIYEKSL